MYTNIEKIFERMSRLIDLMGHFLTLFLSLLLWWGIYSGVHITVSDESMRNQTVVITPETADPATLTTLVELEKSRYDYSGFRGNPWTIATGY